VIWLQQMYYKLVEHQASYITIKEDSHQATKNMTITAEEGDISDESDADDFEVGPVVQTRSGQTMRAPQRLIEEIGASTLSEPELRYYERLAEYGCISYGLVGAGIGGGFVDTQELHVMKFNEAMQTRDKNKWLKAVAEDHDHMKKYELFKPVKQSKLPKNAKVLSTTWEMKKKANGRFRARLTARGYKQINGINYDEDTKAAPVVNETMILVVFVLMLLAGWNAHIVDVNGAFLHSRFEEKHQMYLEVAQGFEQYYPKDMVLLLQQTLYGTKQAALQFWRELVKVLTGLLFKQSKADPCLFFKRVNGGLNIWISWVDNLLHVGEAKVNEKEKEEFKKEFDCDDVGKLIEFMGAKIVIDQVNRTAKLI
jgi:Reverse transcriptase (RNA-dependent DNA polymerase)